MASGRFLSHFLAALLGALVVALTMVGLVVGGAFDDASPTRVVMSDSGSDDASDEPAAAPAAPAGSATDVADLYARVSPGVVSIRTPGGSGSGFVLDKDGYVLTNAHVVEGAGANVRVQFAEGAPVEAKVVGDDVSTDLALLKIDTDPSRLKPLRLGSSKGLRVGRPAIAIGSPFGLEGTLTTGVLSALGRSIEAPNGFRIENVLQTDAAINPGNSGGPLLDRAGRVVGVNAQIATSTGANEGVGFAIPIDAAKDILPQLKAGGEIKRPFLGVSTQDAETGTGAIVREIVPGGPADDAGLRIGDRVLGLGDRRIGESSDISAAVLEGRPGERVPLRIRRDGGERTLTVTLGTRPRTAR